MALDPKFPPRKLLHRRAGDPTATIAVTDDDDLIVYHDDEVDDEFRMYGFKIRECPRGRSHDWTGCPFVHPGEKARRRDPRRHRYYPQPCPDFRRAGLCPRGDACGLAHGVFECWLHPARYRTVPCRDGRRCQRAVCFFAHTPVQLRIAVEPQHEVLKSAALSPTSTLMGVSCFSPPISPPISPTYEQVCDVLRRCFERMNITSPEIAPTPPHRRRVALEKDGSGGPDLEWVEELIT